MTDLITENSLYHQNLVTDDLLQKISDNHFVEKKSAVNIKESKDWYELSVVAPGFRKKDFNISITNGILTITAEANAEEINLTEYIQQEFFNIGFTASFTLPLNVRTEHVYVAYRGGLFIVTLVKIAIESKKIKEKNLVIKEYKYGQYFHR